MAKISLLSSNPIHLKKIKSNCLNIANYKLGMMLPSTEIIQSYARESFIKKQIKKLKFQ